MPELDYESITNTNARFLHHTAVKYARRMLLRRRAVVFAAARDDLGTPRRIALVRATDGTVVFDRPIDPPAVDLALVDLDRAIGRPAAVIAWDGPNGKDVVDDLVRFSPHRDMYRFGELRWGSAGKAFARWYGEPGFTSDPSPTPRIKDRPIPGYRWLGRRFERLIEARRVQLPEYYEPRPQPLPDATGDPVTDARLIIHVLRDIVDQTAPTSPRALFA